MGFPKLDCISKPAFKDVINAITILESYELFSKFGADLMKALKDVDCVVDLHCFSNVTQSTIKDFLQTIARTLIKRKTRRKKELAVS